MGGGRFPYEHKSPGSCRNLLSLLRGWTARLLLLFFLRRLAENLYRLFCSPSPE
ncbi:MAG: hypothetical protein EXS47_02675 [Candidatus Zambryskibacteria bacterium]|nr:hypothetical protein [Candidatus Zambryskibacteria bacterium]